MRSLVLPGVWPSDSDGMGAACGCVLWTDRRPGSLSWWAARGRWFRDVDVGLHWAAKGAFVPFVSSRAN